MSGVKQSSPVRSCAYGNTRSAPADSAVFVNGGALSSRIAALQQRGDQLEKELANQSK